MLRFSIGIYHNGETAPFCSTSKLTQNETFMGQNFVTTTIDSPTVIGFKVGDYLTYRGRKFVLAVTPSMQKQARVNSVGNAIKYDNIKFISVASDELTRCEFRDVVNSTTDHYNFAARTFSFHCLTLKDYAERLKANLDRMYGGYTIKVLLEDGNTYTVGSSAPYNNNAVGEKNKVIQISNETCWDSLQHVKADFKVNLYFDGDRTIVLGANGHLIAQHHFAYGAGEGLFKISRTTDESQAIITRLRAYGSEKNMPVRFYANLKYLYLLPKEMIVEAKTSKTSIDLDKGTTDFENDGYLTIGFDGKMLADSSLSESNKYHSEVNDTDKYLIKVRINNVSGWMNIQFNGADYTSYANIGWNNPSEYGNNTETSAKALIAEFCKMQWTYFIIEDGATETWKYKVTDPSCTIPNNMNVKCLMLAGFGFNGNSLRDEVKAVYDNPSTEANRKLIERLGYATYAEFSKNFSLSNDPTDPYIDAVPQKEAYGVREGTVVFDGTTEGYDEIYPSIEYIGGVDTCPAQRGKVDGSDKYEGSNLRNDGGVVDDITEAGKEIPQFYLYIKDPSFNPYDYRKSGSDSFKINMIDGMCGGRSFDVKQARRCTFEDGSIGYRLVCDRVEDNSLDLYFPYSQIQNGLEVGYIIKAGDRYTFSDIEMPSEYVLRTALYELFPAAIDALKKNRDVRFKYELSVDANEMHRQHLLSLSDKDTDSIHDTIHAGDLILFGDKDLGVNYDEDEPNPITGSVIINSIEIKENNERLPQYSIRLVDEKTIGTIERIQRQIESITNGSNGSGSSISGYAASEIQRLIRTYGANYFLSKVNDDTAKGKITFNKGIEIGEGGYGGRISQDGKAELDSVGAREQLTVGKFVTGAEGQGAKIDKSGDAEMQNLRVWNSLTVSELRFDRATVLLGTNIQTYCGGVIGKVEKTSATTGYIDLEVEDDEVIGAIQNGALCKGYVNNPATNDTEDSDDWHGDIRYAGTTVAQFAIDWSEGDEPNATTTKHIRYELRAGTTQHPVVGMTFKGVGNMKDSSLGFFTIATPKYTAEYAYVQSWVIDNAACCVHVSGSDISGFASLIGEQTLNPPHGTICTNMYVRGTYRQISNDRRFMYITQDSNGILQDGETETITIKIRDGYLAERTSEFSLTFDGKAIAYDAGKAAFVCTVSYNDIVGESKTFVIKATDGKHELEESIRVRRLSAGYFLNVLKSAVNTNAKYDEELTFNDGAPLQYNDSTTITNTVVGDTIMAVRRNGDAECEVGDLCVRIDNNQEYVIANYEEVRIYGSVKRVVFTWYADSSHSENKIYARQEIPVISTLNSYVIYHDGTDEPALPPVGMAISDYGWHEGQTSSSRWMSAKTSVDMLSGAWGQPVKIVGEDGRSVGIKGHVPNASALALLTGVKDGDGYITDDDGHLHVYYSGTDSWTDVGRVQGEAGKNAYIHIKYSHDGGNSFSENNGETPAEWMAVYADFNPTDSSNLSDYYGKWKKLTGESSFVSMVFRRSSASSLAAPTGGSFAKPLPDGTDWSDGIPDGSLPIWVSRRIFWSDNRATDNWTTPKRMADTADFDVCYHGGEEQPSSLPTSHHQSNQGNGWFDNPADCEGGFAVWMATDQLVNGIWQGWKVSRIKGEKGADGKDGASYVGSSNYYLATATKDVPTTKPTSSELNGWTLGTIPSDYGKKKPYLWNVESIKVVKKGETSESVTFGNVHLLTYYGSDGSDGKGITSITEYFLATAKKETPTVDTGYSTTPADYSAQKPYLWNKEVILFTDGTTKVQDWHIVAYWGQDGKDADSFELRVASAAANISRGYEDELCFNSGDSLEYNNGKALKTIEAGDRISACRYFNMAVTEVGRLFYQVDDNARTEVANNEEQTVPTDAAHVSFHWIDDNGEEISRKVIPVISNGVTRFVSFAFKRQNEMPNTPVSGMFHHPVPDAEGWSDDIPEGTAKVWMTKRDFYSDDRETTWSTPSPMTDTSDFDVEFSANDNYVAIPEDIHGTEVDKSAWGWKNEGNKDSVWMATSTCKNGVWSQWSYSRIKGEDGRSYVGATELYYASDSDDAAKLPNHTISSHADWRSRIGDLAKPYSKERPYLWNFEIVEMIEAGGKSVLRATDPELISYWSKDGKGVESVDERYIATATDDKPTVDPTTCKTNSTEAGFSASKPYLWNNQRTKYSDGSFGEWTGWQQISYWGKDAELFEIRPYSTSANASTGVEEGITFNDGSDIQFNDGVVCSTIEKGGTIYACRYYNGKVSTLGKLYVSVNGGSESLTSNNTGLTIGETDRYVTFVWRKDDNSEIVRTNIPVVSDGVTMFKSFVFKRSEKQPATPTTGSFVEPVPYAEGWSDGIPEGEYRVWMSSRVFSSDDRLSSWSTPSPMTDTETDDYAYSSLEIKPSAPTEHGVQSSSDWHNEPSENDIWMAHDRKINGVWQGWKIMRIKGEKGNKGNKGDSFDEAKYYYKSTKKDVPSPSVSLSNGVPTGWSTSIAETKWGEKGDDGNFHYWLWQVVVETVVGNGGNKTYKAQEAQMIDEYDPKRTGVTETYCANNDANNHPTDGWVSLSSARANFGKNNQYLWKREVRTYSDDSTEAFYSIFEKYAEPGATGPRGKMVRPCGIYNSSRKYYNTDKYVDVVIDSNGNRYMVNEGKTEVPVNTPPPNTTFWTEANEFDFVASKVAFFERSYIENLSLNNAVAGYQVGDDWIAKLTIDGNGNLTAVNANVSGKITSTSGSIGGWDISTTKLYYQVTGLDDETSGHVGCYLGRDGLAVTNGTGGNFIRMQNNDATNEIVYIRAGGRTGINIQTYGNGDGINVLSNAGSGKAIKSHGDCLFAMRSGETINFSRIYSSGSGNAYEPRLSIAPDSVSVSGLRINVAVKTSSYTAISTDDLIVFNTSSDVTLTLPSPSSMKGKVLYVKKRSGGKTTISTGDTALIVPSDSGTAVKSRTINNNMYMYISDGTYWLEVNGA